MTIMQIASVKMNPSGKSMMVKTFGGKDYFAKTGSGIQAGMTIEAETELSEYNGKRNWWIGKWKSAAATLPAAPMPQAPAPQQPQAAPAPAPAQPSAPANINLAFLPFVSNVVAHAIAAGKIEGPADISGWANAAYDAACKLEEAIPF